MVMFSDGTVPDLPSGPPTGGVQARVQTITVVPRVPLFQAETVPVSGPLGSGGGGSAASGVLLPRHPPFKKTKSVSQGKPRGTFAKWVWSAIYFAWPRGYP